MAKYLVALAVGGLMECPEITYENYQEIEANSAEEARKIYNEKNNCDFFYGRVIRKLSDSDVNSKKMSKYILAKYAIDKFQKLFDDKMKIATSENNEFYRGMAHGYLRAADMLRMMDAANVQSTDQWISVKDRLPDEMQDKSSKSGWSKEARPSDSVLILTTDGSYDVAWYSYVHNDWTTDNETYSYCPEEIAFWQPLPKQPPKYKFH